MNKKWLVVLILIATVSIILAVANPDEAQFREWVSARLQQGMEGSYQNQSSSGGVAAIAESLVGFAVRNAPINVKRQNCVFFSIFKVRMFSNELSYVGVAGQFISLD
jgi:hypothetical protein